MLFYLIALIVLAEAQVENVCETKYRCFVPWECKVGRKFHEVVKDSETTNCLVVMKIHPYASNWFRIMLTGKEDTTKIEIKKDGVTKPIFTCVKVGEKVKATYEGTVINKLNSFSVTGKLECEFEVDLRATIDADPDPTIGYTLSNILAVLLVNNTQMKTDAHTITASRFCSPSAIVMSRDAFLPDKHYTPAKTELGAVYCKNSDYTLQFREEESDVFKHLGKMHCGGAGKYKLINDGVPDLDLSSDDDIVVRCVADAKHFCKYNLTMASGPSLIEKDGALKCPEKHFFAIKGQRPIKEPSIKCQNQQGTMKWTLNEKTILTDTSPEVHCLDKLECHVMRPINQSSLVRSFLDGQFLPNCQEGGQLNVADVHTTSKKDEEVTATCDGATGNYYYSVATKENVKGPFLVTENTIFTCIYIDEGTGNQTAPRGGVIAIGAVIAVAVCALATGACCYASAVSEKRRERKRQGVKDQTVEKTEVEDVDKIKEEDAPEQKKDDKGEDRLNDYLAKKREDAKSDLVFSIDSETIKVLDRREERISPELQQLDGKRPGGIKTFVKYTMVKNEAMLKMLPILQKKRNQMKANIEQAKEEEKQNAAQPPVKK